MDGLVARLRGLLADVTRSSLPAVEDAVMAEIKAIAKVSRAHTQQVYNLLLEALHAKSALARHQALVVVDALFIRSAVFRELMAMTGGLKVLLRTCLPSSLTELPPTRQQARALREAAARFVQTWTVRFGAGLKPLRLLSDHLSTPTSSGGGGGGGGGGVRPLAAGEETEQDRRIARTQELLALRFPSICREIEESRGDVAAWRVESNNCFNLLLPRLGASEPSAAADAPPPSTSTSTRVTEAMRTLGHSSYSVQVVLQPQRLLTITNATLPIVETLRGLLKQAVKRLLPTTKAHLHVLARVTPAREDVLTHERLLRECVALREELTTMITKCHELGVGIGVEGGSAGEDSVPNVGLDTDEDGQEFVDVPLPC